MRKTTCDPKLIALLHAEVDTPFANFVEDDLEGTNPPRKSFTFAEVEALADSSAYNFATYVFIHALCALDYEYDERKIERSKRTIRDKSTIYHGPGSIQSHGGSGFPEYQRVNSSKIKR